jgi:hypothetical protein
MPRGVTANVGFSGVDRVNFLREKADVYCWGREGVLTKNHSLRDAFAELSDLLPDVFRESYRLPAAGDPLRCIAVAAPHRMEWVLKQLGLYPRRARPRVDAAERNDATIMVDVI